jgi:hypothetical protein
MKTELKPHCWHKSQLVGSRFFKSYDGEACCNCGITWSEHDKRIPRPGHGPFDPEPILLPKPVTPCTMQQVDRAPWIVRSEIR